jgi:predicted chitinase
MAKPRYAYRLGWRSLKRVAPSLTTAQAKSLARDLAQAMHDFDINTRTRAAMFIAQVCHESGEFRYREEIASGALYEGRRDLGNTQPGDGRRFKGRTFIQITGRSNYRIVSAALGVDFLKHPTWLAHQAYACKGAAWWWRTYGCNVIADGGDFTAVTRRINGGTNGLADRLKYYRRARTVSAFLVPKRRKP